MSAAMVQTVLRSDLEPAGVRLVAVLLAWHANEHTGLAWPGLGTLAQEANVTRDRVKQCIKALKDQLVIEIVSAGAGGSGMASTTRYRFSSAWVGKWAYPGSVLTGKQATRDPVSPLPDPGKPAYPNKDERQPKAALSSKTRRSASPAASGAGSARGGKTRDKRNDFHRDYYLEDAK